MMNFSELIQRKMKFRPSFGLLMQELLKNDTSTVFLVADSARACRFECPVEVRDRVIECGIAEQDMIGVAAGLARCGKKPVAFGFAPFVTERCLEQIRLDVAYSELNIVIIGSESGVSMGTQGVTHYGWEDIAVMRSLPGMTILCPADHVDLAQCMHYALTLSGPVYIRLTGGIPQTIHDKNMTFDFRPSRCLRPDGDTHIFAIGTMVEVAIKASDILRKEGYMVGVTNMVSIKPLDEVPVIAAMAHNTSIYTLEEHSVVNGIGSAVADVLAKYGNAVKLHKIGLPDQYPHDVSPYDQMLIDYELTPEAVANAVKASLLE